ncbi:MAG: alpha/beta hydrolase-fold protein [Anaerolineales bacterium]
MNPARLFWIFTLLSLLGFGAVSCSGDFTTQEATSSPYPVKITSETLAPVPTITPTHLITSTPGKPEKITPSPSCTPKNLTCWNEGGRIETGNLKTALLRQPLEYRIYLPPCYDQQPDRRYPVLYLFHGQGFTADQWERLGVDETANVFIAEKVLAPFIIVMPHDRFGDHSSMSKFGQVIMEVLIPWIDKTYRTLPERDHRAVGGLSRGGGWAFDLGFSHWELFGAVGAHSPALLNNDTNNMSNMLDQIPIELSPRIYIDTGDRDRPTIIESAYLLGDLLNKKGIPHEWYLFTGSHNEDYWRNHLEGYLRWYAKNW